MRRLKVLLVGAGTVGEAIAKVARGKPWLERMVLADYNLDRAHEVQGMLGDGADSTFPVARVDASDVGAVVRLAREQAVDLVMNAADPRFVPSLFDAAFEAGTDYMDMAVSLSVPDADDPFGRPGVLLGDYQFARADAWRSSGRLALLGMGMDPGLTDVFARYAADELFDEVDEVHIRDGGDVGAASASPSRSRPLNRSCFPRASARSSASTSSTRRSCWCRAASIVER